MTHNNPFILLFLPKFCLHFCAICGNIMLRERAFLSARESVCVCVCERERERDFSRYVRKYFAVNFISL
jgi:hypothetical protein